MGRFNENKFQKLTSKNTTMNFIKKTGILLLSLSNFAFAQVNKFKEEITIDNNKKLIVITLDENKEFIEKLTKKNKTENLSVYNSIINTYNSNIKEAVTKFLNNFTTIEYQSKTQFKALKKDQLKNIYVLRHNIAAEIGDDGGDGSASWLNVALEKTRLDSNNIMEFSKFELAAYDAKGKESEILLEVNLYNLTFCKGELFYALSQIEKECKKNKNTLEKNKELSNKTLIINADNLEKGVTEAEIKKNYPHNFKIVTKTEFQKQLMNTDGTVLCLMVVPMAKTAVPVAIGVKYNIAYFHVIYNPLNYNSYMVTQPKGMIGYSMVNDKISLQHIKSFAQ